ncbi:hypothetical protein FA95DRAFT_1684530 [Auriscalpium vulgare]|uniref:Uncharacterized protein n=1 Tax=Auriscalpium vulgare TaxID=40419 RepID=A0ACB8R488_9AGAM|nr:hypothetical protein FA95DRAFT_1684530 [Auriscalpium vulgare]
MHTIQVTTPPSPPAHWSTSRADTPTRTNTLVIAQLPAAFFQPAVLHALRDHFEAYGAVHTWAPIRAFSRIILVYFEEEGVEEEDELRWAWSSTLPMSLRSLPFVSSAARTRRSLPQNRPPAIEKNFLISLPGSPPVGWEPVKEDPPHGCQMRRQRRRVSHGDGDPEA